jgi:hypothetical protein
MVLNAVRRVPHGSEHRRSATEIGFELLADFVEFAAAREQRHSGARTRRCRLDRVNENL